MIISAANVNSLKLIWVELENVIIQSALCGHDSTYFDYDYKHNETIKRMVMEELHKLGYVVNKKEYDDAGNPTPRRIQISWKNCA